MSKSIGCNGYAQIVKMRDAFNYVTMHDPFEFWRTSSTDYYFALFFSFSQMQLFLNVFRRHNVPFLDCKKKGVGVGGTSASYKKFKTAIIHLDSDTFGARHSDIRLLMCRLKSRAASKLPSAVGT